MLVMWEVGFPFVLFYHFNSSESEVSLSVLSKILVIIITEAPNVVTVIP